MSGTIASGGVSTRLPPATTFGDHHDPPHRPGAGCHPVCAAAPAHRTGGVGFSVFHIRNDATNISEEFARESLRWFTNTNLTARLTSTLNTTMNAHYSPPRDLPQGRHSSFVFSSVGLRQQLFDQKTTLNLFVNDPLDIARYRMETRDRTHIQLSRTENRMRSASLSISYNFGKPPQQHSRRDPAAAAGTIQQ